MSLADMFKAAALLPSPGTARPSSLEEVLSEEPVPLDVFVTDKKFLNNPELSDKQYQAVRRIERVYYPALYPLMAAEYDQKPRTVIGPAGAYELRPYWGDPIRMVNFVTLEWGKGSGKDHVCRIASMRVAYLLSCLRSPQDYYGMPEQDTIHLLNVASSSSQAQQAFFAPITRAVKKGWFKDRCVPHKNTISFAKHIECVSGHSDAESQEGLNLMLGIADEIDAFKSKAEMASRRGSQAREPAKSAEGILEMMQTSGSTRFPEVYKNVRISYPRYRGSTIQMLRIRAQRDNERKGPASRHYVSGPLATWEVNPRVKGKEAFAQDYEDDPVMAAAKYECRPARASNPFFRNEPAIDACFSGFEDARPPLEVDYVREGDIWRPSFRFAEDFFPIQGAAYSMHGDLAVTQDRAGIAMAHVVRWEEFTKMVEGEDGLEVPFLERRPYVKVDFVIGFEADTAASPAREIQIRWARQLAFFLIERGFNIRRFTFDGFQSTDSIQILGARGIESSRVSTDLSTEPWKNLRDLMYESRIKIPGSGLPKENDLLRTELLSLTKLPNGRVDHPSDFSKDLADALACSVLGAVELGGQEDPASNRAYYGGSSIAMGSPVVKNPLGLDQGMLAPPLDSVGGFDL